MKTMVKCLATISFPFRVASAENVTFLAKPKGVSQGITEPNQQKGITTEKK